MHYVDFFNLIQRSNLLGSYRGQTRCQTHFTGNEHTHQSINEDQNECDFQISFAEFVDFLRFENCLNGWNSIFLVRCSCHLLSVDF